MASTCAILPGAIAIIRLRLDIHVGSDPPQATTGRPASQHCQRFRATARGRSRRRLSRLVGGPDALPRIYWHARGQQSPEYVALGAIHELTRPEDIQRVCDLAGTASEDSPRYYGGLAFDPDLPGWQGFGPCRFVLPPHRTGTPGSAPASASISGCPPGKRVTHSKPNSAPPRRRSMPCNPRPPARPAKAAMAAPGPAGPCPVADPGGAGHGPRLPGPHPKVVLSGRACSRARRTMRPSAPGPC